MEDVSDDEAVPESSEKCVKFEMKHCCVENTHTHRSADENVLNFKYDKRNDSD